MRILAFVLMAFTTLASCESGESLEDISMQVKLPLTYHLNENEPRSSVALTGKIFFDKGCFYLGEGEGRIGVVFPDSFKYIDSSNSVLAGDVHIKSGQQVITDGVVIKRSDLESDERYLIRNAVCVTENLVLLGSDIVKRQ